MITKNEIVSPESQYACKLCGEIFGEYDQAFDCITSHSVPLHLLGYNWHNADHNCPDSVFVELSDGRIMEYRLLRMKCAAPKEEQTDETGHSQTAEPE